MGLSLNPQRLEFKMKHSRQLMVLLLGLLLSCHVSANELSGLWKAYDENDQPTGYIRIVENNDTYIGVIEKGMPDYKGDGICHVCKGDRKNKKLLGMTILKGVVAKGKGRYTGTEILDPISGNTYKVNLQLKDSGQTLLVRGYIGMPILGQTREWKRAENGQ